MAVHLWTSNFMCAIRRSNRYMCWPAACFILCRPVLTRCCLLEVRSSEEWMGSLCSVMHTLGLSTTQTHTPISFCSSFKAANKTYIFRWAFPIWITVRIFVVPRSLAYEVKPRTLPFMVLGKLSKRSKTHIIWEIGVLGKHCIITELLTSWWRHFSNDDAGVNEVDCLKAKRSHKRCFFRLDSKSCFEKQGITQKQECFKIGSLHFWVFWVHDKSICHCTAANKMVLFHVLLLFILNCKSKEFSKSSFFSNTRHEIDITNYLICKNKYSKVFTIISLHTNRPLTSLNWFYLLVL